MRFFRDWEAETSASSQEQPEKTGAARLWEILEGNWGTLPQVNLLFLAGCLPVVTIPLSLFAMHCVMRRRVQCKPKDNWYDFKTGFRRFWKQAYAAFFLTAGLMAIAGVGAWFYLRQAMGNWLFFAPFLLCSTVFLSSALSAQYLYGFLADGLNIREAVRRALTCGLGRPLRSIAAAACALGIPAISIAALPFSGLFLLLLGFSTPCLLGQFLARTLLDV